jgi:hypothetical protein
MVAKAGLAASRGDWLSAALSVVSAGMSVSGVDLGIGDAIDGWIGDAVDGVFGSVDNFGDLGAEIAVESATSGIVRDVAIGAVRGAASSVLSSVARGGDIKNAAIIGAVTGGGKAYLDSGVIGPEEDEDFAVDDSGEAIYDMGAVEGTFEEAITGLKEGISLSSVRDTFNELPEIAKEIILNTTAASISAAVTGRDVDLAEILPTAVTQAATKVYLTEGIIKDIYDDTAATPEFKDSKVALLNSAFDGVIAAAYSGADASAVFQGIMDDAALKEFGRMAGTAYKEGSFDAFYTDYSTKNDAYYDKFESTEALGREINKLVTKYKEGPLAELTDGEWDELPFTLDQMQDKIAEYNERQYARRQIERRYSRTIDTDPEGGNPPEDGPWGYYGPGYEKVVGPNGEVSWVEIPLPQSHKDKEKKGTEDQSAEDYSPGRELGVWQYREIFTPQSGSDATEETEIRKWVDQYNLHYEDYVAIVDRINELKVEYDEKGLELGQYADAVTEASGNLTREVEAKLTPIAAQAVVENLAPSFDPEFYKNAYQNEDETWKDGADIALTPHEHWLRSGRTNTLNQKQNDALVDHVIRRNITPEAALRLPHIVQAKYREEIRKSDNPEETYRQLFDKTVDEYISDIKTANNISFVEDAGVDIDVIGEEVDDTVYNSSVVILDSLTREAEASGVEFANINWRLPIYEKAYEGEGYQYVDPSDMGTKEVTDLRHHGNIAFVQNKNGDYVLGLLHVKEGEDVALTGPVKFDPKSNTLVPGEQKIPNEVIDPDEFPTFKNYYHTEIIKPNNENVVYLEDLVDPETEGWYKNEGDLSDAIEIISHALGEGLENIEDKLKNYFKTRPEQTAEMKALYDEFRGLQKSVGNIDPSDLSVENILSVSNALDEGKIIAGELSAVEGTGITRKDVDEFYVFTPGSPTDKKFKHVIAESKKASDSYATAIQERINKAIDNGAAYDPFYETMGADAIPRANLAAKGAIFVPLSHVRGVQEYDNMVVRRHMDDIDKGITLSPTELEKLNPYSKGLYDIAKWVTDKDGDYTDSTTAAGKAHNGAVLVIEAGGELIGSFIDVTRYIGLNPEDFGMRKVADSMVAMANAGYTNDYSDARNKIRTHIREADGVWGTLYAAGEAFVDAPGVFITDIVVKEMLQELPYVVGSGGVGLGVRGSLRLAQASRALSNRIAVGVALTANNAAQFIETAGGTSGEVYRRVYSTAKSTGMSDEQAEEYALNNALAIGATAAIFELVAGGRKDVIDNLAARIAGGKRAQYRSALEEAQRRLKGVGREGLTEAIEEGYTEGAIINANYQLTGEVPPDWEGDITWASTQGALGGTGTAAAITLLDIVGGSPPIDTGSPTGNALINIDPKVKDAFNNASQDPSGPDYDSASQQAGEDTLKDVFGWNEFFGSDGTILDFERDSEGVWRDNINDAVTVLNTANPDNYTTLGEVEAAFADADTELGVSELGVSSFTPTEDQLLTYTGEKPLDESNLASIRTVIDDATFGTADARRIATEAGYTLGSDELTSFVEGLGEGVSSTSDATDALLSHIDIRQVNPDEVTELLGGVPATPEQIAALTGQGGATFQEDQTKVIQDYRGLREITTDEVIDRFAEQGYMRPDAETDPEGAAAFDTEVAKYVGVSADPLEEDAFGRIIADLDPKYVTEGEARQVYEDLGIISPAQPDIDRFTGLGDETKLATGIESYLPVATYNYLTDISSVADIVGVPGRDVTQDDIDIVNTLIADQVATDSLTDDQLVYDVTGDRAVDATDLNVLQGIMAGTTPRTDVATTSPFASTGLYGAVDTATANTANQIAAQTAAQTATQTAIQTAIATQTANEEERRRKAEDERFMASLLETTPVRVDTPDPGKIEYVYDPFGDSIFATEAQRSFYGQASPYGTLEGPKQIAAASGGLIEDETDTILRILEGR